MITRFDSKHLFENSLSEGLTLFCGAGFSVLSYDQNNKVLPVGDTLLNELKEEFEDIKNYSNLHRACTKISRSDKSRFYEYLEHRFTVSKFDPLYLSILKLNLKSIYTTNIDDLFFKIFEKSSLGLYLHDRSKGSEFENKLIVDYYPLHGCVRNKDGYVFGATEIATAFSNHGDEKSWKRLARDSASNPILFWGWNFEDPGPIEAMYNNEDEFNQNIKKWVLLYEPTSETIDFLDSLGFNIIIGDTISMLDYFNSLDLDYEENTIPQKISDQLKRYTVPANDKTLPSYSISRFFIDYAPQWSHIYSGKLPKLKYYKKISDLIAAKKDVIVIGIRGSGKTTLMMQLLCSEETNKQSFYMVSPSLDEVKSFIKILGSNKCILFVDDCFRDTEAVLELLGCYNIQAILFDRDFNYERQFHKIAKGNFEKVDITEISLEDAQSIINIIPRELSRQKISTKILSKDPTILNLLAHNLKSVNFNFINKFYAKDPEAAKTFLMVCYVHFCGIPCSFDMIYSFLDDTQYTWEKMFDIIDRIGGLLKEILLTDDNSFFIDSLQDYYQCRSRIFAEKVITSIPHNNALFREVLLDFTERVPQYKICQYDKFKRSAYDADLITKAFPNIKEGEAFYRLCSEKDGSEYMFQQAALYFANAKEYKIAFEWIDKARSIANYNRFSIDSTYSQIYFDVNYLVDETQAIEALNILEKCCSSDKRRILHVEAFAQRCIKLHEKYHNDNSMEFLNKAHKFVLESISEKNLSTSQINKWRLKKVLDNLNQYLNLSNV